MTPPLAWLPAVAAIVLAVALIRTTAPEPWRVLPFSVLLGLSYLLNFYDAGTVYYGIRSDQSFHLAFIQTVAHGRPFSDYYHPGMAAWYPPLYFWLTGFAVWLTGLPAIVALRWLGGILFALLPFLVYRVAREFSARWPALLSTAVFVGLAGLSPGWPAGARGLVDFSLMKPYEVYAGLIGLLWLLRVVGRSDGATAADGNRRLLVTGALGGLVILAYAPWYPLFFLAAVGFFVLRDRVELKARLVSLAAGLGVSLAVSSPYWLPFLVSFLRLGGLHQTATGYFPAFAANPLLYAFGLGRYGLPLALGLIALWKYRRKPAVISLGLTAGILYLWVLSTPLTRSLFGASFLPTKALIPLVLTFTLLSGPGLEILLERLFSKRRSGAAGRLLILVLLALGPHPLLWNLRTDPGIEASRAPVPRHVRQFIQALEPDPDMVLLAMEEGAAYLTALTGVRVFVAPNLHFANPLSDQEQRLDSIRRLTLYNDPGMLAGAVRGLGIDLLLFWKMNDGRLLLDFKWGFDTSSGKYNFFEVRFPRSIFENRYFRRMYEDEHALAFAPLGGPDDHLRRLKQ